MRISDWSSDVCSSDLVGRDAMDERLAIIVKSVGELEDKLRAFIDGRTDGVSDLYVGQARQNRSLLSAFAADEEMQEALDKWIQRGKFSKLLEIGRAHV